MGFSFADLMGPVGTLFKIGSGVYGMIQSYEEAKATAAFRTDVVDRLQQIDNLLTTVNAELGYLSAQQTWNTLADGLKAADSDIDDLWRELMGAVAITNPPTPINTAILDPASSWSSIIKKLPHHLVEYDRVVCADTTDPSTGTTRRVPLIRAYIDCLFAQMKASPDASVTYSVCDMAYAYWVTVVAQQFRAYFVYALASKLHQADYPILDVTGWNEGDTVFRPYVQAQATQAAVNQAVQDYGYDAICGVLPPRKFRDGTDIAVFSVVQSGMFEKFLGGASMIPDGHVLVTWRLHGTWNDSYLRLNNIGLVLYHGVPDPVTGLVPASAIQALPVTWADGDNYIDPNDLIVCTDNTPANRTIGDPSALSKVGAWWITDVTAETPSIAIPEGSVLTGLSVAIVGFGPTKIEKYVTEYVGGYSPGSYPMPVQRLETHPGTGSVYFLRAQYLSSITGTIAVANCHCPSDLSTLTFKLSSDQVSADLQRAQFVTFACVGADNSRVINLMNDEPTFKSAMAPMTGFGLTYYTTNGTSVISPRNIHSINLHRFAK